MGISKALTKWNGPRCQGLDRLKSAHSAVATGTPGRQWLTEELNHAIIIRLSAEFQGFARDLHTEAVQGLFTPTTISAPAVQSLVIPAVLQGRTLDRGNPSPGNLGTDFQRLGMQLWPTMRNEYRRARRWNETLEALNVARNALAHQDDDKLAEVMRQNRLNQATITNGDAIWRLWLVQWTRW